MKLCLIFADQLSFDLASLQAIDPSSDRVLLCELMTEATHVPHHPKKIALLCAAMRHFAQALRERGYDVCHHRLEDENTPASFMEAMQRQLKASAITEVVVTSPSEYRLTALVASWHAVLPVPLTVLEDHRFLCTHAAFAQWAKDRKQLRMEYFYRTMRQQHDVLMDHGKPVGGQWNFDAENRKSPPKDLVIPKPTQHTPDAITAEVLTMVAARFGDHFGDVLPFHYAVTHAEAKKVLDDFIRERLPQFGDYQDAMLTDEPWMFHAHIGLYLNCGLLDPMTCIRAAEAAYHQGQAPLNAVEGFIRQILGWREFVRGIYWHHMPDYADMNHFSATRPLPSFFWDAETDMNCVRQCVQDTRQHAYAHHIQRLMVLGNFALLAGLDPKAVNTWYLVVYADAYEWVEMPNVTGMVLFADGGILASKPYAAGGSYIQKMSNYCQTCRYKVSVKVGPGACPFNYLYWGFLMRHRAQLANNPRIAMMYRTLDRMSEDKKAAILQDTQQFLAALT